MTLPELALVDRDRLDCGIQPLQPPLLPLQAPLPLHMLPFLQSNHWHEWLCGGMSNDLWSVHSLSSHFESQLTFFEGGQV